MILRIGLAIGIFDSSSDEPNFLFIIVDDQSPFDLKVYDPKSALETPNIDRLAREGLVFDGSYHMGSWKGAVCTCSRHMIMTGRTVWHLPGFKTKDKGATDISRKQSGKTSRRPLRLRRSTDFSNSHGVEPAAIADLRTSERWHTGLQAGWRSQP